MKFKIFNITIFFCIGIVLLLFLEILLRLIIKEEQKGDPNKENLAYQYHPKYLVSLRPNVVKTYIRSRENGGAIIHWRTNSHSFRGNPLRVHPCIRLIVYGDSNIHARFSELKNTFCYRLEEYLKNFLKKDIEVINAGIIGFGPDQSLIRFREEVNIYKPDFVIFHISSDNDFGDVIRNRLFQLDSNGHLIETNYPRTVDEFFINHRNYYHSFNIKHFLASLYLIKISRSCYRKLIGLEKYDWEKTAEYYLDLCKKEYQNYKEGKPRAFSHFADHYDLDVALNSKSESSVTKIKLVKLILKQAKALACSKQIGFMVTIQPSSFDMLAKFQKVLSKFPGYNNKNLTDLFQNICSEMNIPYINLFNLFNKNNPEELFFKGLNFHWNDKGQDIAAKETAKYLTRLIRTDLKKNNNRLKS